VAPAKQSQIGVAPFQGRTAREAVTSAARHEDEAIPALHHEELATERQSAAEFRNIGAGFLMPLWSLSDERSA